MSDVERGHTPPRRIARSLVRSLATGTPILEGAGYIHVGHRKWIDAQIELLGELAEDNDSDVVFVRGTYGAGKTHFLACVQERAQEQGWATSHIECRCDQVQLDRFETVYPKVIFKIRSKAMMRDVADQGLDPGECDGGRWFLNLWTHRLLKQAGYSDGPVRRPMEVDDRLYGVLHNTVFRTNLPGDFQRALCAYARGTLVGASDLTNDLVCWFRGEDRRVQIPLPLLQKPGAPRSPGSARPSAIVELRPINRAVSLEVLRGMLWVIRQTGHKGLVLGIDELEEIAKLSPKKRQDQCFQTLREFVDNSDGDLGLRYLCTYFAATPEMFDSEDYFRRYDALSTRIEPIGDGLNYRSPVVNLDKTPLTVADCRDLAGKVRDVHAVAHEWNAASLVADSVLDSVVKAVMDARYRVAKPRLLCRVLIDELERARQQGKAYTPRSSHEAAVRSAAEKLQEEAKA